MTCILTHADLHAILATHGCTPATIEHRVCGQRGTLPSKRIYARRPDNVLVLLDTQRAIARLSAEELRTLAAEKLALAKEVRA